MADLGPDLDMACSKRWKVDAENCCFKEGNQEAVTWMKEDKPDLTEVRGLSQAFKWTHAGSQQLELIDLQGNNALREHFGNSPCYLLTTDYV